MNDSRRERGDPILAKLRGRFAPMKDQIIQEGASAGVAREDWERFFAGEDVPAARKLFLDILFSCQFGDALMLDVASELECLGSRLRNQSWNPQARLRSLHESLHEIVDYVDMLYTAVETGEMET